ncbi:hypothetical protein [Larkinella punicea]|uniref:Outer membrane protein beta-barrel domain-containing protein n=1 Tax=Larkinella punicea TaxID=2315727 RepID=A0A368JKV1_9BACT|nr:hypothetical protein [Larkinella punicea]RCR68290.1 hypothetical protein DUE52_18010 [Larkinella punicea]
MNKSILAFGLYLGILSVAQSQINNGGSSIRVGIDYMSLKAPEDFIVLFPTRNLGIKTSVAAPDKMAIRYVTQFVHQIANNRIVIEGSIGFIPIRRPRLQLTDAYYVEGHRRQRFTGDMTVLVNFIKNSRHAIRLGGGPSVWYRMDNMLEEVRYVIDNGNQVIVNRQSRQQTNELNVGYHLTAEYAYELNNRFILGSRLGIANFKGKYGTKLVGIFLGYRL